MIDCILTFILNSHVDDKPPIFYAQVANTIMQELSAKGGNGGTLFHQMLLEAAANSLQAHNYNAGVDFTKNVLEMVILLDSQQSQNRQVNPGFLSKLSKINKIVCFQYLSQCYQLGPQRQVHDFIERSEFKELVQLMPNSESCKPTFTFVKNKE